MNAQRRTPEPRTQSPRVARSRMYLRASRMWRAGPHGRAGRTALYIRLRAAQREQCCPAEVPPHRFGSQRGPLGVRHRDAAWSLPPRIGPPWPRRPPAGANRRRVQRTVDNGGETMRRRCDSMTLRISAFSGARQIRTSRGKDSACQVPARAFRVLGRDRGNPWWRQRDSNPRVPDCKATPAQVADQRLFPSAGHRHDSGEDLRRHAGLETADPVHIRYTYSTPKHPWPQRSRPQEAVNICAFLGRDCGRKMTRSCP
jgi:hypothetical protein